MTLVWLLVTGVLPDFFVEPFFLELLALEEALDQTEEAIDEPDFVDIVFIVVMDFDDIVDASQGIEFFEDLDLELLLVVLDDLEVLEATDALVLMCAVQS